MNLNLKDLSQGLEKACIISVSDKSGKITYVNDHFCNLCEYSEEELIGNTHKIINSSHHKPSFFEKLWGTISKGEVWQGVIRNKSKSGKFYWVNTTIQPCTDSNGKIYSYLAILFDVTMQLQSESLLKATIDQLNELNFVLDQFAIIASTDFKGRIKYVNDKFCDISGFSREELIGKNHRIINSNYHEPAFFTKMWTTIQSGEIWSGEIKNKNKKGSYYWVKTTIIPLFAGPGKNKNNSKPTEFVAIRQDITKEKELEETALKEKALAVNRSKLAALGELSAGIAHEVGNPLNAIQGRAEMLHQLYLDKNLSPEITDDYAQRIIKLCERMSKIINGLSSYSKDSSKDPVALVNLSKLLDEIIDFSTHKFRNNKIHVIREGVSAYSLITAREAEIAQVITNLINNACDAVLETEKKEITIRQGATPTICFFEIIDSGPGIAPEVRNTLYESFVTTKGVNGTGLGLNLSQKIVHRYSGTINFTTSSEAGTCFRVEFPRASLQENKLDESF